MQSINICRTLDNAVEGPVPESNFKLLEETAGSEGDRKRLKRKADKLNWARTHRESVRRSNRKQYLKNIEKRRAYDRKYHAEHKQQRRDYAKKYHVRHYLENRERLLAQTKAYAQAHPEIRRKIHLNYKKKHPDKFRAQLKAGHSSRKARLRGARVGCPNINRLIKRWRMRRTFCCYWCGERFGITKLHVDHILPIAKGGRHEALNVCPSCPLCNIRKRDKLYTDAAYRGQLILL